MTGPLARLWQGVPRWVLAISDQGLIAILNLTLSITVTQVAGLSTLGRFAVVKVKLNAKALTAIAASAQPVAVAIVFEGTAAGNDPATSTRRLTLRP